MIMKINIYIIISIIVVLFCNSVNMAVAQNLFNIQWAYCYGGHSNDQAQCIQNTFDKGFIIIGF